MIDSVLIAEDNKTSDINTLINRAENAELSKKFTIAANHYFTLLTRHVCNLNEDLVKKLVDTFIFNILLSPVGLQRERMLNFVLKNENLNVFEFKHFLDRVYRYQLIKEDELNKILLHCPQGLQKYINKDNNLFEKAIFEHNLISLSKVYENINFNTLEKYLNLNIDNILNYTFIMILENKIKAKIDEINKFIFFLPEPTTSLVFDKQIHNFCLKVLQLTDYIKKKSAENKTI